MSGPQTLLDEAFHQFRDTLQQAPNHKTFSSRVLDDPFHFMDRLLRMLPKKHSVHKHFAHDFSEAIFIRDKDDVTAVRAVLEKRGVDWEYAKRAKASNLNRRIRRYIPHQDILLKRVSALFEAYKDIKCSTSSGGKERFFSKQAREMAKRLLVTIKLGFLSDPPGVSLYCIVTYDRDGLPIYRIIRGTSSVESFHRAIRRVFGALQAGPELAECLVINWIGRRNLRVSWGKSPRGQ